MTPGVGGRGGVGRSGTILLVGMMGAGKSTVGRLLATLLDRAYVDSDEEVEAATGRTVRELFEAGGERAFRPLESEALAMAVGSGVPVVIGVAGGAVLDPSNRALLRRSGTVVWLRATPETLAARIARPGGAAGAGTGAGAGGAAGAGAGGTAGAGTGAGAGGAAGATAAAPRRDHRPLLEHDPEGELRRLAAERRPLYEEVADVVVDVDAVNPASVVDRVLSALDARQRDGAPVV